jgi:hypothetical protein
LTSEFAVWPHCLNKCTLTLHKMPIVGTDDTKRENQHHSAIPACVQWWHKLCRAILEMRRRWNEEYKILQAKSLEGNSC